MRAAANNSALLWRVCQSRVLQARLLTYMRGKATSDRGTVLAGPPAGPAPLGPTRSHFALRNFSVRCV